MKQYWITNKKDNGVAEVFLYGYIDPFDVSAGDFVKELRQLEKEHANINVRINSGGGSVFEGLAIYNAMQQSSANIETYIDGIAASMASIIALGGKKCHMSKSARIMTHQPSTGSYGTTEEHEKNVLLLKGIEKTMLAIYCNKTGKKEEECRAAFMNGKDNWFTAEEAKESGLVDNIYDADPVEMPKNVTGEKHMWDTYNVKFAAVLNQSQNQNNDMKIENLSAASLAALNITAGVTDAEAVNVAIAGLKAKADLADKYKGEKETAENALATEKANSVKADVAGQLKASLDAKSITKEQHDLFATQYADKPEELKALLATMKPFVSVLTTTELNDVDSAELKALAAMSGDDLFNDGNKLERLKELSLPVFKAKYKEAMGQEYVDPTAK